MAYPREDPVNQGHHQVIYCPKEVFILQCPKKFYTRKKVYLICNCKQFLQNCKKILQDCNKFLQDYNKFLQNGDKFLQS